MDGTPPLPIPAESHKHTKLESTVRYLGIEVDDALTISEQVECRLNRVAALGFLQGRSRTGVEAKPRGGDRPIAVIHRRI